MGKKLATTYRVSDHRQRSLSGEHHEQGSSQRSHKPELIIGTTEFGGGQIRGMS